MNIAVIGAGEVGMHIAAVLSRMKHNVVVIDSSPPKVRRVEDSLDVQVLEGHGTDLDVLERAGVGSADLVLAVSNSDETNFGAALLSKRLGARQTVVRARKHFYLEDHLRTHAETFQVDRVVCPEVLTAQEIAKRIEHPGTEKLEYFAHGRVQLRSVRVDPRSKHVGARIRDIPLPGRTLIASIARGSKLIVPGGDDVVQPDDMLSIIGSTVDISRIESMFRPKDKKIHRVVIVGGGLIGFYLARILERRDFGVTLIERRMSVCKRLATQLTRTDVIHGDATVLQFLKENRFAEADAFAATTSNDDTNLMAGLLMRELGTPVCSVVMHRPDFASLVERLGVSYAFSPRYVVADTVINMLQQQHVLSVAVLDDGQAEVIEFKATENSPVVGRVLKEAHLPRGMLIGVIIRQGDVMIPKGDDMILAGDTVVVLVLQAAQAKVERMFRGQA